MYRKTLVDKWLAAFASGMKQIGIWTTDPMNRGQEHLPLHLVQGTSYEVDVINLHVFTCTLYRPISIQNYIFNQMYTQIKQCVGL